MHRSRWFARARPPPGRPAGRPAGRAADVVAAADPGAGHRPGCGGGRLCPARRRRAICSCRGARPCRGAPRQRRPSRPRRLPPSQPKAEPEPQAAPAQEPAPEPKAEPSPRPRSPRPTRSRSPTSPTRSRPPSPRPSRPEPKAEEPAPEVAPAEPERRLVIDSEPRKLDLLVGDTARLSAWLCPVGEAPFGPDEAPATADDACAPATGCRLVRRPRRRRHPRQGRGRQGAPDRRCPHRRGQGHRRARRDARDPGGVESRLARKLGIRGSEREPGREVTARRSRGASNRRGGQLVPESRWLGRGTKEPTPNDQQAVADETAESLPAAVETETAIEPSSAAMPYDLIEPAANSFSVTPVAQTVRPVARTRSPGSSRRPTAAT